MADPIGINENVAAAGQVNQGFNTGAQQGMQLAQAAQEMQQKQVQTQQMQEQLETSKFNTLSNNMQILAKARPEVARKLVPAMKQRLQQSGIAVDSSVLDLMASDDQYKQRMIALSKTAGELGSDSQARQQFLSAHQDLGTFDQGLTQLESYDKELSQQSIAKLNADKALGVANIAGQARVDAAGLIGGRQQIRNSIQAGNQYSKEIGPSENAIYQANRAFGLVDKIDEGKLKSTKLLTADLESAQASLLGGGKPSTVYGQQAVHMDDIYSRAANTIQFLSANPQDTQSPAKLAQLKLDLGALKDFYDEQHQQRYNAYRQGLDPSLRTNLDNRYKMFRKTQKMDTSIEEMPAAQAPGSAPAAGAVPTAAPAKAPPSPLTSYKSAEATKFIQDAQSHGYSDQDIADTIKKKGWK